MTGTTNDLERFRREFNLTYPALGKLLAVDGDGNSNMAWRWCRKVPPERAEHVSIVTRTHAAQNGGDPERGCTVADLAWPNGLQKGAAMGIARPREGGPESAEAA